MQQPPFVSLDWYLDHAHEVITIDARAYLDDRTGRDAYASGHLPGATFVDLETVFADPPAPVVGRHPLPDLDRFVDELETLGVNETDIAVVYDDAGGMIASRLVWMLRMLGQPAAVLDGGMQGYVAAGGLLDTDGPVDASPTTRSLRSWDTSRIVDSNGVDELIASGGLVVDSRGRERFRGEVEPMDPQAGHVPGAVSLPFADHLTQGHLRPLDDVRARLNDVGVDEETVFYCGSGVSACVNLLAAEAAGIGKARLYVGSWSGWSSEPGRPVATGDTD